MFSAINKITGQKFAIKQVKIKRTTASNVDQSRALLYREIKVIESVKHVSCPIYPELICLRR